MISMEEYSYHTLKIDVNVIHKILMIEVSKHMSKSQHTLLALIIVLFIIEVVLTIFFISFSSFIYKGLTIIHSILISIFIIRQVKRKGM